MWSSQKGFSLVEATIAMGLLTMAVFFGMNTMSSQSKTRVEKSSQAMTRFLAVQATQAIMSGLPYYPPLALSDATKTIAYAACFNNRGESIPDNNDSKSFALIIVDDYPSKKSSPLGVCQSIASYEVRFYWSDMAKNEITITIVRLFKQHISSRPATQNFKIIAK